MPSCLSCVHRSFVGVAATTLVVLSPATTPHAQTLPDYEDLPDWSGVWQTLGGNVFDDATVSPRGVRAGEPGVREHPPYTAEWEAKYRANLALVDEGRLPDPLTTCGTPPGFPRVFNLPGAIEFVVRPEQVWILTEDGPSITRIHTDGRSHPPPNEVWPTFSGESVGHWEGDVLVFETIGMKGEEERILDRSGLILSEQASITTRMQKIDDGTMEVRLAIDDPEALTETWHVVKRFERLPPGSRMFDVACTENNRNPVTQDGRTLTLDAEGQVLDTDYQE